MILVIDIGSSSLKLALINKEGVFKYQDIEKYNLINIQPNIVEMDMIKFDLAISQALKRVGTYIKNKHIKIKAISLTSQRSSVIPVDEQGRALSRAITWQDTRASKICEKLKEESRAIRRESGMFPSPIYSAPKMALLKEIKPNIYDNAYKLVGFCEYTLFKLCGVWATDTSIASRTGLFNISELQYSSFLINLYQIDKNKLSPIVEVGSKVGETLPSITNLLNLSESVPVFSAGGDQQCAALGNGCITEGDIAANFGTGAYVLGLRETPLINEEDLIICNVSAQPDKWLLESSFNNCGLAIEWVNNLYFAKESYLAFEKASRRAPLGSNGLQFHPSKGLNILNLNKNSSPDDIARSVLEGIVFTFAQHYSQLQNRAIREVERVVIGGGVSRDPFFNQMISTVLNQPVLVSSNSEATLSGAWISTATRLGLFNSVSEAYGEMAENYQYKEYLPSDLEHEAYKKIEKKWKTVMNYMEEK